MDALEAIAVIEEDEHTHSEHLEAFAALLRTGVVWSLQGSYQRTAQALVEANLLTPEGEWTEDAQEFYGGVI